MKTSFTKLHLATLAALVVAGFALVPYADAAGDRGGGGGRGGDGGARAAGGGGGSGGGRAAAQTSARGNAAAAQGGGAARQNAQVNNTRADVRTNNVRSTSVNNVNVERNVNVNVDNHGCCNNGWDNDYHPVATAAAVGTAVAVTSAIVGSIVNAPPPGCAPINYGGMVYQQCGNTWYAPQGAQFVVVKPPY